MDLKVPSTSTATMRQTHLKYGVAMLELVDKFINLLTNATLQVFSDLTPYLQSYVPKLPSTS